MPGLSVALTRTVWQPRSPPPTAGLTWATQVRLPVKFPTRYDEAGVPLPSLHHAGVCVGTLHECCSPEVLLLPAGCPGLQRLGEAGPVGAGRLRPECLVLAAHKSLRLVTRGKLSELLLSSGQLGTGLTSSGADNMRVGPQGSHQSRKIMKLMEISILGGGMGGDQGTE